METDVAGTFALLSHMEGLAVSAVMIMCKTQRRQFCSRGVVVGAVQPAHDAF